MRCGRVLCAGDVGWWLPRTGEIEYAGGVSGPRSLLRAARFIKVLLGTRTGDGDWCLTLTGDIVCCLIFSRVFLPCAAEIGGDLCVMAGVLCGTGAALIGTWACFCGFGLSPSFRVLYSSTARLAMVARSSSFRCCRLSTRSPNSAASFFHRASRTSR